MNQSDWDTIKSNLTSEEQEWLLAKRFSPYWEDSKPILEEMGFDITGENEHFYEAKAPHGWTYSFAPMGDWLLVSDADGNPRLNQYQSDHASYIILRRD